MTIDPMMPSYATLEKSLEQTVSSLYPAEVHGLMCGYICAIHDKQDYDWDTLVPGIKKNKKCQLLLDQLFETTYHQLSEFSFEFSLLLPSDNAAMSARAESLGLWCQGFIIGIQQSAALKQKNVSEEITNALEDLTEIAQVDYNNMSDTDEDETAYFELVEHVRLAALMIYHELAQPDNTDPDHLLH